VLPRRLGVRFALEALFLVALAVGAGLAHLRALYILLVMAAAWLLVALAEVTAERIDRSPLSYLLPQGARAVEEEEPERVFGPRPEERTVVAPLEPPASEAVPETEPPPAPEPSPPAEGEPSLEPSLPSRMRSLLRRREPELEQEPADAPRHVKLLPRRSAPEHSRASQEVAELFGGRAEPEEDESAPEEAGK